MRSIAFVFQTSKLFKTSIFENVKMGNKDASDEEVMNALRLARCEDILAKFPEREKTVIGSKGVHLSGGEIQRVAIARAILKNADIIILDEASAAADPENEYEIQQAFSNLMKNKTVIMIAHRLSSIKNVDEILVVEDGNIVERGSDAELMQKGGNIVFGKIRKRQRLEPVCNIHTQFRTFFERRRVERIVIDMNKHIHHQRKGSNNTDIKSRRPQRSLKVSLQEKHRQKHR